MIHSLFEALVENPQDFLDSRGGTEFEDRIVAFLRASIRYSSLRTRDITNWGALKAASLLKSGSAPIANDSGIAQAFIREPNGKQNYPDFLMFEENEVVCVEVKCTKTQPRPVWNSGLPRPNGFYIRGRRKPAGITFFRGRDVISPADGRKMHEFFDRIRKQQIAFNQEHMSRQPKGFAVYIRRAFEQKKEFNRDADTDYFNSPERAQLEQNALNHFA